MDIRKLQLFADVAETENFTKSGNRMGYTQSGVSHMLKSLEDEMGFFLFIRSKQGVKLTKSGQAILPAVRSLLSKYENLQQTINEINGIETGSLSIATFSSISINWLPKIIYEYKLKFPEVDINVMEGGTDDIIQWVESDICDLGFVSHRKTENMEWFSISDDPLYAVVPKGSPKPEKGSIDIKRFQDQPFIISAMGTDYDVHHALSTSKISPDILFSSKDDHAIVSMVANGLGISILPGLTIAGFHDIIDFYPLNPYYSRELGICVKSKDSMTPAAQKFVSLTNEMLPKILKQ